MAFALFCRKFGNVVIREFLVLIFWVKKLVGANFYAFLQFFCISILSVFLTMMIIVVFLCQGKMTRRAAEADLGWGAWESSGRGAWEPAIVPPHLGLPPSSITYISKIQFWHEIAEWSVNILWKDLFNHLVCIQQLIKFWEIAGDRTKR